MAEKKTKVKIGRMPCEGQRCTSHADGFKVFVLREAKHGTLSYTCPYCSRSRWAKKDEEAYADWMQDIEPLSAEEIKNGGAHPDEVGKAPAAPAAPAAKPKPSFSMDNI